MTDLKQMLEEKPKGRLRAEDLRIANIVYHPGIDLPIEITWAYLRDLPNLNLQGIKLTEEWLRDFGVLNKTISGMSVYKVPQAEYYYLRIGIKDWQSKEIKYVHQLQNLYHSLTGTDLKINPETL